MSKKIVALIIFLLFIIPCVTFNAVALDSNGDESSITDSTINIDSLYCVAGDIVDVNVNISNNPGIAGARFTISFDENLNLLEVIELNFSPIVKRIPKGNSASLFVYPFLVGTLFAFAASPCSTPILAGIMSFATLTKNILLAGLMLLFFSLGQGVIVVLAGLFTTFLKGVKNFANISEILVKISGILLIFGAILIYIKVF